MRTSAAVVIAVAIASARCGAASDLASGPLSASVADAPAGIRADCELAEHRCTRCHTIDRIVAAPATTPAYWRAYVRRMRLTPGSGIRPAEEPAILRCLLYRSFGPSATEPITAAP